MQVAENNHLKRKSPLQSIKGIHALNGFLLVVTNKTMACAIPHPPVLASHDVEEVGVYPTSVLLASCESGAIAGLCLLNGWLQLSWGFWVYLLSSSSRMLFNSPT